MCSHHFFARDASYIFTTYLVALHQAQFICASTTRLHTAATRRDATKGSQYPQLILNKIEKTFKDTIAGFVLFDWMPSRRKEVSITLRILPHVQEQNKRSLLP